MQIAVNYFFQTLIQRLTNERMTDTYLYKMWNIIFKKLDVV